MINKSADRSIKAKVVLLATVSAVGAGLKEGRCDYEKIFFSIHL